jgi:hypothetical protein
MLVLQDLRKGSASPESKHAEVSKAMSTLHIESQIDASARAGLDSLAHGQNGCLFKHAIASAEPSAQMPRPQRAASKEGLVPDLPCEK